VFVEPVFGIRMPGPQLPAPEAGAVAASRSWPKDGTPSEPPQRQQQYGQKHPQHRAPQCRRRDAGSCATGAAPCRRARVRGRRGLATTPILRSRRALDNTAVPPSCARLPDHATARASSARACGRPRLPAPWRLLILAAALTRNRLRCRPAYSAHRHCRAGPLAAVIRRTAAISSARAADQYRATAPAVARRVCTTAFSSRALSYSCWLVHGSAEQGCAGQAHPRARGARAGRHAGHCHNRRRTP
jgi:hypothetical protein